MTDTQPQMASARRFYLPQLDALRFLAFGMVLLSHARMYFHLTLHVPHSPAIVDRLLDALLRCGVYGVDLFFALSGYLITSLLLMEKQRTGEVDVQSFYIRRMLRIWPLYYVSLFLLQPLSRHFFLHGDHVSHHQLIAFTLMVGNWYQAFGVPIYAWIASFWSLNIEEQFYMVWPHVARLSKRGVAFCAAGLFVFSCVLQMVHFLALHQLPSYYSSFQRLHSIALGCLLGVLLHQRREFCGGLYRCAPIASGAFLFWLLGLFGNAFTGRAIVSFPLAAVASVLVLYGLIGVRWRPGRVGAVFVYLGKISFGLYVFHMAFVELFIEAQLSPARKTVAALLCTIAAAMLSYHGMERPFLKMKERFAVVRSREV